MPWTIADVSEHNKSLKEASKKKWVKIANGVRRSCLAEGKSEKECSAKAIKIANAAFIKDGRRIK